MAKEEKVKKTKTPAAVKKMEEKKLEPKTSEAIEIKVPAPVTVPVEVKDDGDGMLPEDFIMEKDIASKPDRYFEATGRRKTAVARVRLFTRGEKQFMVNGKQYTEYFGLVADQETAVASMKKMKCLDKFKVTVIVNGGGRSAQAEAVRHGTARVLVDFNNNFKKRLRKVGFLTRDPRMRERKKFGLKRARKSPQWAKR